MKSRTTARFRSALASLPREVQDRARDAFELFERDASHPSLRFKQVHPAKPIFSARVTRDYRALAVWNVDGDEVLIWFWIGSHAEYDRLLRNL